MLKSAIALANSCEMDFEGRRGRFLAMYPEFERYIHRKIEGAVLPRQSGSPVKTDKTLSHRSAEGGTMYTYSEENNTVNGLERVFVAEWFAISPDGYTTRESLRVASLPNNYMLQARASDLLERNAPVVTTVIPHVGKAAKPDVVMDTTRGYSAIIKKTPVLRRDLSTSLTIESVVEAAEAIVRLHRAEISLNGVRATLASDGRGGATIVLDTGQCTKFDDDTQSLRHTDTITFAQYVRGLRSTIVEDAKCFEVFCAAITKPHVTCERIAECGREMVDALRAST